MHRKRGIGHQRDDGCSPVCLEETCGDGVRQKGLGETCDAGNNTDLDGCNSVCIRERCGDGIVHPWEECDDGAKINNDGCSSLCKLEVLGDEGPAVVLRYERR